MMIKRKKTIRKKHIKTIKKIEKISQESKKSMEEIIILKNETNKSNDKVLEYIVIYKINWLGPLLFIFIYTFLPVFLVWITYFYIRSWLINKFVVMPIPPFDLYMKQPEVSVNHLITPFLTSILLILVFIFIYVMLNLIKKKYFHSKRYAIIAKRILTLLSLLTLFIGIVVMVYNVSDTFLYTDTDAYTNYLPDDEKLVKIAPAPDEDGNVLDWENLEYEEMPLVKQEKRYLSNFVTFASYNIRKLVKYLGVITTMAGAIFFPLKSFERKKE